MWPPKFLDLLRTPGFVEQAVDRAGGGLEIDAQRPQPATQPFTFAHVVDLTYTLSPHCGTHVDAPYHVSRHGLHTDEVPVRSLVAPAVLVDRGGEGAA